MSNAAASNNHESPPRDDSQKQQKDLSPLTEITSTALAKAGISNEEAAAILSDPQLMQELRDAQRLINESAEMAKDANNTLVDALVSEGINMSDEDIRKMMDDIENNNSTSTGEDVEEGEEGEEEELDEEQRKQLMLQEQKDQEEFGNLIQELTKMAVMKQQKEKQQQQEQEQKSSSTSKIVSSSASQLDSTLLPILPLIAEFSGALPALYCLPSVCQRWRGLLLSDSRVIQRTLWIGIACNEFPVEVSELGEDAFVSVSCWSDVVKKFVSATKRKSS